ncbi:hypothetical protein AB0J80_08565 [Actinoplanes sp. NPDC049548]|uniref:hypothetical protein n=1 Tax=Actinoplanes sp. NPDC049548 TaxID=3155152 RepID=UPI003429614C
MVSELQERDARRFIANVPDMMSGSPPGDPVPGLGAIDGTDSSGTVYCVVDLGGNLLEVGISDGWWDAVGPRGVAAAVLASLRFARDKAGLARMVLNHHGRSAAVPASAYRIPSSTGTHEELPPYDAPNFPEELGRKLERAARTLAKAERFARERDSGARRELTGPRGLFRVEVSGSAVMGATVNEQGLGPGDGAELAADAREVLLAARRRFDAMGEL